jgi:DNA-binding beta-propeller fold protein YncE
VGSKKAAIVGSEKADMIGQAGRGRRMGVILIAAGLLVLASAPEALGADRVYWGNGGNNTISYANLDGSGGGGQLNISGATPSGPRGVAIDSAAGRIYWANQSNNTISYANLDGSGGGGQLDISGATPSKPTGLAIDPAGGRIYWTNDNDTISYANLDGSGGDQLDISGAPADRPYGATIDPAAGRIYWGNLGTHAGLPTVAFASLDGSGGGNELNISGATANEPHGVAIDPATGRIYWTNLDSTIWFANLDGSGGGGQFNTSGAHDAGGVGMAIDPAEGRIYWGNLGNSTISYANLDGSGGGGQLNISGATASQSRFPALLRSPSGAGAPRIAGGSSAGSVLTCSQGAWAPDLLGSFLYRAPRSFTYQWSRDGAEIGGATHALYIASVPGDYRCRVTATNAAGATSQTSAPHTVPDLAAPSARITDGPKDKTKNKKARFEFTGSEATALAGFQCSLDRAPFVICASPYTVMVKKGKHTFQVEAMDKAGNVSSPATDDWKVMKKK